MSSALTVNRTASGRPSDGGGSATDDATDIADVLAPACAGVGARLRGRLGRGVGPVGWKEVGMYDEGLPVGIAVGAGTSLAYTGEVSVFMIRTKDLYGNDIGRGGDAISTRGERPPGSRVRI